MLEKNSCDVAEISSKWDILKNRLHHLLDRNSNYLDVWSGVFTSNELPKECVLHIIELLLITPFSNAKLERMFSTMARVKTDWRNRPGRDRLEESLRISQEGTSIDDFCPDAAIELWFHAKVRRLNCSSHHGYPKKRKTSQNQDGVIEITG